MKGSLFVRLSRNRLSDNPLSIMDRAVLRYVIFIMIVLCLETDSPIAYFERGSFIR